jgi:hypothetical protein
VSIELKIVVGKICLAVFSQLYRGRARVRRIFVNPAEVISIRFGARPHYGEKTVLPQK